MCRSSASATIARASRSSGAAPSPSPRHRSAPASWRALDHGETLEPIAAADAALALPSPKLDNFHPRQKYALAIFGEKSSLFDEIDPVAERLEADLYLETGEQSISHAHNLAVRAAEDGRVLVIVTLTDFDPSGRQPRSRGSCAPSRSSFPVSSIA